MPLEWRCSRFTQLGVDELFELMQLRIDVFVVEQRCAYSDLDHKDRDPDTRHLRGHVADGSLVAYARLLRPGLSFPQASIGRIVTAPAWRAHRLGHALVTEAIRRVGELWPDQGIRIGAQSHLQAFYRAHGFETVSDEYLEDGIPHRDMLFQV